MWWDESTRTWRKHPMCTCEKPTCICAWLPPLDDHGKPLRGSFAEAMRGKLGLSPLPWKDDHDA